MSNIILSKSKFIHIPKCGGTAIQSLLWNIGCVTNKSQTYVDDPLLFGHLFPSQMPDDNKVNFTFVRNPISWWQSWYWWNKTQELSRFNGAEKETESFDKWVEEYGQLWLGLYSLQLKRYLGEDKNFPTTNRVTLIGKCENLYADLKNILDVIGEEYDADKLDNFIAGSSKLPKEYSNTQSYNRSVSSATKQLIYQTEKEVFTRFGYIS